MAQQQPKGMKWTVAQRDKSRETHKYNKVGTKASTLVLSGAEARWKKSRAEGTVPDIYISELRLAGNPELIREVFRAKGEDPAVVEGYIRSAYTIDNYNVGEAGRAFAAEVAAYKAYRKGQDAVKQAKGGPAFTLADLEWISEGLSEAKAAPKAARAAAAGSPGRPTRVRSIAARLEEVNAKPGKVLDVSKLDLVKGTGAKTADAPTKPNGKKIQIGELRIISDSPAAYAHAVMQLQAGNGFDPKAYVDAFNAEYNKRNRLGAPAAGLAPAQPAFRAVSPTRGVLPPAVPGALAPLAGGLPVPGSPYQTVGSPRTR